ncbi:hypothetical protein ABT390_34070 [Streptomyces aurantiacus]|uniref:Uncharacterized protein n=1 Tax=Streptomyces aurantiacus JA 4570 TaxID=1286094 RepID=S3ZUI9_9ACTN|nr:hypothetical protein [Streptomyces aurantiacus]EPH46853.1 hypothetical protein STRAU_0019 [Streptomyces aurantiacus JA 4570]
MSADVVWGGQWEHPVCGATGDVVWDDEDTASSGHDCGGEGEVTWRGAGAGVEQFGDDTTTLSGHDCETAEDEHSDGGVGEVAA